MKHFEEREIRDLLTPDDRPVPPPDLAARIKAEIPNDLVFTSEPDEGDVVEVGRRAWPNQGWLLAASLATVLGGVWLAGRTMHESPRVAVTDLTQEQTSETVPEKRTLRHDTATAADPTSVAESIAVERSPVSDAPPAAPNVLTKDRSIEALAETQRDRLEQRIDKQRELERRQLGAVVTTGGETDNRSVPSAEAMPASPAPAATQTTPASEVEARLRRLAKPRPRPPTSPAGAGTPPSDGSDQVIEERIIVSAARPSVAESKLASPTAPPKSVVEPGRSQAANRDAQTQQATSADENRRIFFGRRAPSPPAPSRPAPSSPAPSSPVVASPAPEPARVNRRVEEGNQQIRAMEAEARQLEAELRELEAVRASNSRLAAGAPDAMTFRDYGSNPFVDTAADARSTFALDVDTGAYNVVRGYLNDGHLPPAGAVRVEEMINRFDYGDPPPQNDDFALHAEGAPVHLVDDPRRFLLRLGVRGREVVDDHRPPADLIFVVDVSGSMARENRLGLVRQALTLLVDQMGPADRVALVVYGTRGQVVLPLVTDPEAIRRALGQLRPNGSTNAEEGLRLAYELALRGRRAGTISRVILCSDGVANVGRTGPEGILSAVRNATSAGVELTTVGFGMGNYNDVLMEQLADQGNGRYAYVDDLDEARRIFVESLTGTLLTIAAETKAQVAFNPEVVARYRLIGYENRDIADEDFRNDAVDAGEIGAGHAVTALYEIDLQPHVVAGPGWHDWVALLTLRWGSVARGEMVERKRQVTGEDFAVSWDAASTSLRWSALVARLGEQLKGVYGSPGLPLEVLREETERLSPDLFDDPDFVDFRALVAKAAALSAPPGG